MSKLKPTLCIAFTCILLSSCAVQHHQLPTLSLVNFDNYHTNNNDGLQYGYFENVLEYSENKRLIRWAKRKNYQIIGFNVINISDDFRKGYQLKFYRNNKQLSLVRNEWVADKAKQKAGNTFLFAIPFFLLETAIRGDEDENTPRDEYGFKIEDIETTPVTNDFVQASENVRKEANRNLLNDLRKYDISHQVLPYGVPVYGVIVIDDKIPVDDIEVRL